MSITAAQITAATFTDGGNTRNVFKSGTFPAVADGATVITLVPDTGADSISDRDINRFLYIPSTRNKIKIVSRSINTVTLERPIDVSDFRATLDSQGNAYTETGPTEGDKWTIQVHPDELVTLDNTTLSNSGTNLYVLEGTETIELPNDCLFGDFGTGSIQGRLPTGLFNMKDYEGLNVMFMFGRVHPNWTSGETTPQPHYTSGGYCITITEGSPSGDNLGASIQAVNSQYRNASGAVSFIRFYGSTTGQDDIRCIFENTIFSGRIGGRLQGEKSYVVDASQISSSYFGFNLRSTGSSYFGLFTGFSSIDSSQSVYYFPETAGTTTTYDGLKVIDPRLTSEDEYIFVNNSNTQNSGKTLNVNNSDLNNIIALDAANADWRIIRNSSGSPPVYANSFTRFNQTVTPSATDASNQPFDDIASKIFVYTEASSGDDITYTETSTDGSYANIDVRVRSTRTSIPSLKWAATPDADDILYSTPEKPARLSARAYGYIPVVLSSELYEAENPFEPIFLIDNDITETDKTIVDAYTSLEDGDKLYDFSRSLIYDNPQGIDIGGQNEMFTKDADTIVSEYDITFQTADISGGLSAELDYTDAAGATVKITSPFTSPISADLKTVTFIKPSTENAFINAGVATGLSPGSIVCSGHVSGDTIIDTTDAIDGIIELTDGTYTITGGADVSDLTINAASGNSAVVILLENVVGDITLGTGVTAQKVITITYQLEENWDVSILRSFRWVGATSPADYGTKTKKDHLDSDVNIVPDNENDTVDFIFTIDLDDSLFWHIAYEGYENEAVQGDDFTTTTLTPTPIGPSQIDFDEVATGDDITLEAATPVVGSTAAGAVFAAVDDEIHISVPLTVALTITGNFDKKFVWRAMHTNNYVDGVLEGFVPFNPFGYLATAIQLNLISSENDYSRFLGNFSKSSSSAVVQFASRIIDAAEIDLRTTISPSDSLTEVRFGIDTSGASYQQVVTAVGATLDERDLTQSNVVRLGKLQTVK